MNSQATQLVTIGSRPEYDFILSEFGQGNSDAIFYEIEDNQLGKGSKNIYLKNS